MPGAEQLLNHPAIVSLGWTLVHFLWQGCVIALVYGAICFLAPRRAATLRYWAGLVALLISLLVILITFVLSYAPEARFVMEPEPAEAINPFLVLSGSFPDPWVLLESGIEPVLPWLVLLWLVGVMVVCISTAREWVTVHRLLREAIICSEVRLLLALDSLKAKLGVHLAVRLMVSARVSVPLAVGSLRPVILMPVSVIARLPQDQLEMILAHELGHIRRFDYAFNLLQVVLETLLFYHPAIAWMSQRVREEREHCCDDLVVRECGRPATYARALTNLEFMRSPALSAAVPATGGNLLARVKHIIDDGSNGKSSNFMQFVLVALAGLVVAFGAHQGYALSKELNRVAYSAQLQTSDVQWKIWGLSRQVWGQGINRYAESVRERQLAALDLLTAPLPRLVEPGFHMRDIAELESQVAVPLELQHQHQDEPISAIPDSLLSAEGAKPRITLNAQPPAERIVSARGGHSADGPAISPSGSLAEQKPGTEARQNSDLLKVSERSLSKFSATKIKPLKSRPPKYPWRARRQGVEGFVELEYSVNAKGKVTDVEILDAAPEGVFEEAATKALSKWTFAGSENSGSRFRQVFDFELQELERVARSSRPCLVTGSRTCGQIAPAVFVVWVNSDTKRGDGASLTN